MARGMRRVPTYYQDLIDIIGVNPGHVIGSTACLGGALPTQILRGTDESKLNRWISQMIQIFGKDDFYLEMQPSANKDQIKVNRKLLEFANNWNLNYIITTDSHYLKKEDRVVHKAYLNAQNGEREVDEFYATTYMMGTEELESYMKLSFVDDGVTAAAYESIAKIIEKCEDFSLAKSLKIPQLSWIDVPSVTEEEKAKYFKEMPMLGEFYESPHLSNRKLAESIVNGIRRHRDCDCQEAYREINECLKMTKVSSDVNKASWASYFLNLQKIVKECWNAGTLVGCGRGSGVGFILLYLLDITQINPLRETTKTYPWRFLNPDRVSVLDVDIDIEGGRRSTTLKHLRQVYGEDRVANVATFGTEKSKSAILTACRGLGIDIDVAQYLASLIPAERGMLYSLSQCFYGDEENDIKPIKQFVIEMNNNYPEVWNVAQKIEGLVCRLGEHAGGIIFVDEPFTESTGLMRAPNGDIITQFDLHDCEDVSLIKYDLLSVEALDKMHICLDLLKEQGYVDGANIKEIYDNTIGVYKLERNNPEMWKMVWNHQINSLFQMEKQSGIQGISLVHPESVDDLATLNSVIRLMAQEKGGEQPLNKFARFKNDISLWYKEMEEWGLTTEEMKLLEPIAKISYGITESQESFMQLVQMPQCGGFDLTWADRLRKSIAKKNPKEFEQLTEEYYDNMVEKKLSKCLCNYVWKVLVAYSRGYGFNKSHTLAYSLIALQEMNLAFNFPLIFWNCACLINDAGGDEDDDEEEEVALDDEKMTYYNEMEEFGEDDSDDDVEDSYDEEDCDGYPAEVVVLKDGKKKKKLKTTNYGKIAAAIGKMKATGVDVTLPDINKSTFTFTPDAENNRIIHGLSGITRISPELIEEIIKNRPYNSLSEFLDKVKVNKLQAVSLIKSGCFDSMKAREQVMDDYLRSVGDQKNDVNLRNMQMLVNFNLLPPELDLDCRIFNFNKYLKKFKEGTYYNLDNNAVRFYSQNFDLDDCEPGDGDFDFKIRQTLWDKQYKESQNRVRPYVKSHRDELLKAINDRLLNDIKQKYAQGSLSQWEMESVSYYSHPHELEKVKGFDDFFELPEQPEIDKVITIKGKMVPMYKIHCIIGTVLDRDKMKKTVTLLTTKGVVTVSIFGQVFAYYDKQISEKGADGKKHVIEKSRFSRGNKLIMCGIRRDDRFICKKYKNTPYHLVEWITNVDDDGAITTNGVRYGEQE